jgi:hypothetical protein
MFTFAFTGCLAVVFAQAPVVQKAKESPPQPKLLVKDVAFFIHAVPTDGLPGYGLALIHTTTATGEMKILARGYYAMIVVPMGIDRIQIDDIRIGGVAVAKERLYVLKWEGRGIADPYRLLVFRPQDGKLIATLKLKGDGVPKDGPKMTAAQGPLRLHVNGVSCFGVRFEFKGTKLIKQSPEKRP